MDREAAPDEVFRRAMLESAVGAALIDAKGDYVAVNRALCEYLGYAETALREIGWRDVTRPLDPVTEAARRQSMDLGMIDSYQVRSRHQHASGRPLFSLVTTSALRDDEGQVAHLHLQVVDITAETMLEETMRLIATQASDVMIRLDDNCVLQWVSPTVEAVTGWRPEQLMGVPLIGLIHPDERTLVRHVAQGLRMGQPGRVTARLMGSDSQFRWFGMQLQPTRGPDGESLGPVGVLRSEAPMPT